jgi:hypothetical protein
VAAVSKKISGCRDKQAALIGNSRLCRIPSIEKALGDSVMTDKKADDL